MSISEQLARRQEIKTAFEQQQANAKREQDSLTEAFGVPLVENSALNLGKKGLKKVLNKIGVKASDVEDIADKIKNKDVKGLLQTAKNKLTEKLSENDTVKALQGKQENIKANINNLQNTVDKISGDDGTEGTELKTFKQSSGDFGSERPELDEIEEPFPPAPPAPQLPKRQNFNMRRDLIDDDADPFQPTQGQPVYNEVKINSMPKIQPTGTQEGSTETPTVQQPTGIEEPSSATSAIEDAGEDVGEAVGEAAGEAAEVDAIGGGPEDPISDIVALGVGIASLIGGLTGKHSNAPPPPPLTNFYSQIGVDND